MSATARLPHYVTVEDGRITGFECPSLYGACHFYPSCDHETWSEDHYAQYGPGHEREHHEECWLSGWFGEDYWQWGTAYVGPDSDDDRDEFGFLPEGLNRSGPIRFAFWYGEYTEWEFK